MPRPSKPFPGAFHLASTLPGVFRRSSRKLEIAASSWCQREQLDEAFFAPRPDICFGRAKHIFSAFRPVSWPWSCFVHWAQSREQFTCRGSLEWKNLAASGGPQRQWCGVMFENVCCKERKRTFRCVDFASKGEFRRRFHAATGKDST